MENEVLKETYLFMKACRLLVGSAVLGATLWEEPGLRPPGKRCLEVTSDCLVVLFFALVFLKQKAS